MQESIEQSSNSGIALAFLSALMLSLYTFWYKFISADISHSTALIVRGITQFGLSLLVTLVRGRSVTPDLGKVGSVWEKFGSWTDLVVVVTSGGLRLLCIYRKVHYRMWDSYEEIISEKKHKMRFMYIIIIIP